MTRIIGILIILVGLVFFALGASPLIAIAVALSYSKPISTFGGNAALLIGAGIAMIAYGWQCARHGWKRFKEK
jgi:hypothetical protein